MRFGILARGSDARRQQHIHKSIGPMPLAQQGIEVLLVTGFVGAEGHFQAAIEQYSHAIELNPLSAVYLSNRAAAYVKVEEAGSAIIDAGAAIKLDPNYIKVHSPLQIYSG